MKKNLLIPKVCLTVIATLSSMSLLSQSNYEKKDKDVDLQAVKTLVKKVILANTVFSKDLEHPMVGVGKEIGDRQNLAGLLGKLDETIAPSIFPLTGATTPLRVRGGAMTFRHEADWGTDTSDNTSACVALDTVTYGASIEINQDPGNTPAGHAPPTPIALFPGWEVDLYGRTSTFSPDLSNGIRLQSTATCQVEGTAINTIGIRLTPISLNGPYLYPKSLEGISSAKKKVQSKRYQNSSVSCQDDEDACEHMSNIHVAPGKDPSTGAPAKAIDDQCQNGDCLVRIIPTK